MGGERKREGERGVNIFETLMVYAYFVLLTLSFIPRTFIILAASIRPDDNSAHLCTCPKRPLQQHTYTRRFHFMHYGNHFNLCESYLSLFAVFPLTVYLLSVSPWDEITCLCQDGDCCWLKISSMQTDLLNTCPK